MEDKPDKYVEEKTKDLSNPPSASKTRDIWINREKLKADLHH